MAMCALWVIGTDRLFLPAKEFIMIRKAIALACAAATLLLAACNTIEGAGKDIERGGEKLQGAAERAK